MHWVQISLETQRDTLESLEQTLNDQGAVAITYGDAADQPLFEPGPGDTPLWDTVLLQGLFAADQPIDEILAQVNQSPALIAPAKAEILEDKDWSKEWMQHFKPIRCGERLWICPRWHEPPAQSQINLMLDPGMAFGTGTHPTTRLCLSWLDNQSQRDGDFQHSSVIDYGCGSGILAIAALLLGCERAWATDIDPLAIDATHYNAQRNEIALNDLECGLPHQVELPCADILIANILAGPLVELAPLMAAHCHVGGSLVLSGLLENQIETVTHAYLPWFDFAEPTLDDGWVMLNASRTNAALKS